MNLIKDESGLLGIWVDSMIALAIVIIMYSFAMPLEWYFANSLMNLGAPAGTTLFLMKMFQWGLILMGVLCVVIPFLWTYYKVHDQGYVGGGRLQ